MQSNRQMSNSPPTKIRREEVDSDSRVSPEKSADKDIEDITERLKQMASSSSSSCDNQPSSDNRQEDSYEEDPSEFAMSTNPEENPIQPEEPTENLPSTSHQALSPPPRSRPFNEDEALLHDLYYEEELAFNREGGIHSAAAVIERDDRLIDNIKSKGSMTRTMRSVAEDIYLLRASAYSSNETNPHGFAVREQCGLALSMNPNSVLALNLRSRCYETIAMSKPINDPDHSKYLIRALADMKNAAQALHLKVRLCEEQERIAETERLRTPDADEQLEANNNQAEEGNNNNNNPPDDPNPLPPLLEEEPLDQEIETPPGSDGESSSGFSAGSVSTSSNPTPPRDLMDEQVQPLP